MSDLHIRRYQPGDETAIKRICFETALYGEPIAPLLNDPELVSQVWLSYYIRFEPESLWVADVGGTLAGYLTGCLSTSRYQELFIRSILPWLIARILIRGYWIRPLFWRLVGSFLRNQERRRFERETLLPAFPAHCHVNVASDYRQQGIGSLLLDRFQLQLRDARIPGLFVVTGSTGSQAFFQRAGFQTLGLFPALRLTMGSPKKIIILGKKL